MSACNRTAAAAGCTPMCSASKDHHKQSLSISPLHHHQHRRITVHATGNSTAITSPSEISRRQLFAATVAATTLLASRSQPLPALALPLAPLGKASSQIGGEKLTGLTPQQVADILARNLREGEYFITGDLTPEIFDDSCRFKDPTNDIVGLSRYVKALGILFDPGFSAVRLKDIQVVDEKTIEASWILGGYLKLPWNPRVEPFEGHTVYTLGEDGLIVMQDQTWSISSGEALRETFTPTSGKKKDIYNLEK